MSIEYEGHDVSKTNNINNPKEHNQPRYTKTGKATQNGLFAQAVEDYKKGKSDAEIVRGYEKLFDGVWSEKGFFKLTNYSYENDSNNRKVFKYILDEVEIDVKDNILKENKLKKRTRIIPSHIKQEVWARDSGKCVVCGATDELHFDHDLPYSKGGTSITPENVKILCARHNLEKSDKIE